MENAELRRKIEDTINMLPEKCRQVFRMSYLNGMHNNDIAEELQLSVRTVEAHMYRALRFLRERLGECLTVAVIFFTFSLGVFMNRVVIKVRDFIFYWTFKKNIS